MAFFGLPRITNMFDSESEYPFKTENDEYNEYLNKVLKEISNYEKRMSSIGIEPPEQEKPKSLLSTALETLDKPRSAVAAALKNLVTGQGSFTEGLIKGWSGEEKVSGSDLLEALGITSKPAKAVAGFVVDILTDPLTYVGTSIGKGIAAAGSKITETTLEKIPTVSKVADAIGPNISNLYVRRSNLAPGEDIKKTIENIEKIYAIPRQTYGLQQIAAARILEQFKDIPEEVRKVVPYIVESPISEAATTEVTELKDIVRNALGDKFDEQFQQMFNKTLYDKAKNVKVNGKKLGERVLNMSLEELAQKLGEKKFNALTRAADKEATKQLYRIYGEARLLDDEEILKKAKEYDLDPEQLRKALDAFYKIREQTARLDMSFGLKYEPIPNYVYHLYKDPPEKVKNVYAQWSAEQAIKTAKMSKKGSFQLPRTIMTLQEAKEKGLHPIEDIATIAAVREMESIRIRAMKRLFDTVKEMDAPYVITEQEHKKAIQQALKDNNVAEITRLNQYKAVPSSYFPQNYLVHPEIAQALERALDVFTTTGGLRQFFDTWNKVQNIWKMSVTTVVPSFHLTNMFGNFFNNYLAGVVNPSHYVQALRLLQGDKNFNIVLKKLDGVTNNAVEIPAETVYQQFLLSGLTGFGQFRGETKQGMLEIVEDIRRGWQKPTGLATGLTKLPEEIERVFKESRNPLTKALSPITGTAVFGMKYGRAIGDLIETWTKLAHYIAKLKETGNFQEAAKSVKQYLFDYSDITPLEKAIRNFIPFYTFTRKNIPLQLKTLITNPAKVQKINYLLTEGTKLSGVEQEEIPDWLKNDLAIPLSKDEETGVITYLRPRFSLEQLSMIDIQNPKQTLKEFASMITPLIKVPFEVMTNKTISGKEIVPYEGARGRYYLPLPGQKEGQPYQLPAWFDYAVQQTGGLGREIAELLTWLAGQTTGYGGESPELGRRVSDLLWYRQMAPEPDTAGKVPATLRQAPFIGSFVYRADPRRQAIIDALHRRRQLQNYVRYLKDVYGIELPTVRELEKGTIYPFK